jgi:polysaccharide export outer membrane protein
MSSQTSRNPLAALALAACLLPVSAAAAELPPPDPVALTPVGSAADYRVGPQDVIEVAVFQAPDFSRTVEVDAAGNISLPLIGLVAAAGRTPSELQSVVTDKLSAKYMQSPEVTVSVREFASQKVTVDGAVGAPGVYPIKGRTSLMQAVALAKGTDTKSANEKSVVIFRTVNGQRMAAKFDLAAIRKGEVDDPRVYGNDVIMVERSGTKSLLNSIASALPVFSIFRAF